MNKASTILLASIIVLSGLTIAGVQTASAVTFVEGHITVDTIWTVADAPYVVSNDVYVDNGATLTIEPGVRIRFGGNFDIAINGNLNAVGTSGNEIVFTSNKLTPAPGDWNTIKFNGAEDSYFNIRYCTVEYGKHSVTVDGLGWAQVTNCEFVNNSESGVHAVGKSNSLIKGNTMKLSKYGISTEGNDVSGFSAINNEIINNTQDGVFLQGGNGVVHNIALSDNIISSNGGNGVYLDSCYINNVTFYSNVISSNNENAFHLCSIRRSHHDGGIKDVIFSNNKISSNTGNGVYLHLEAAGNGYISDITLSNNVISSNNENGAYLYAYDGNIYNITLSNNTISYNTKNGIYLYGIFSSVYRVAISNNSISSNKEIGIKTDSAYYDETPEDFNIYIRKNIISANNKGIGIYRNEANIANNSIAYNAEQGVYLSTPLRIENVAHFNDIYQNKYGMNITSKATVNAERNYWGDSSGPYHKSMNPWGLGNPVNGDGTDLDFIPFLTSHVGAINERPVPHTTADKTTVGVDEGVRFDASDSTDDQRVVDYYFDYGDGTSTGWVTTSVVVHKYLSEGIYNVTLKVRDEYGVEGEDVDFIHVTVGDYQTPIANFIYSPENPFVDETITFDASNSTDPDGTIVGYAWDFGDGNTTTTTETIITHFYALERDYNVTLTVTDDEGATDLVSKTITITSPPPGDVNHDGSITSADVAIMLEMAVRGGYDESVDINNDGRVNSLDALMILQAVVGRTEIG